MAIFGRIASHCSVAADARFARHTCALESSVPRKEIAVSTQPTGAAAGHYMTLCGLPVTIEMRWPFHPATAGSDFHVIHGRMTLAAASGEKTDLHAELSVQITQVIKEALPSLDR